MAIPSQALADCIPPLLASNPTLIPISVGVIIALLGIYKQRQSSREKNSIDFEAGYKRSKDIQEAWITLMKAVRKASSEEIAGWAEPGVFDTEEASAFRLIMNEWERAANGVFRKVYDNDFLYKTYGSTVIDLSLYLHPYIKRKQQQNPRIYLQFTRLSVAWKIQRSKEDRIKVDKKLKKVHSMLNEL